MKRLVMCTVAAAMLGAVAPSMAACLEGDTCFTEIVNFSFNTSANHGGMGEGVFFGEEGGVRIEEEGSSGTNLTVDAGGALCGLACTEGTFTFNAVARQQINSLSLGIGTTPGESVRVVTEGAAFSNAIFGSRFDQIIQRQNPVGP